jgi:hypothetical protein
LPSHLSSPEVSSKVCHDSFCRLGNSVSLPWVIHDEAFYLHVVSSFSCIPVICLKLLCIESKTICKEDHVSCDHKSVILMQLFDFRDTITAERYCRIVEKLTAGYSSRNASVAVPRPGLMLPSGFGATSLLLLLLLLLFNQPLVIKSQPCDPLHLEHQ